MTGSYAQAELDFREGRFGEAARLLAGITLQSPHHTAAHYYLGLSLHALGRVEEGIAHYRAVLAQMPDYLDAWINLGDLYAKAGQRQQAIAAWEAALQYDAESVLVLNNLGIVCRECGQDTLSLAYFRRAAAIEPDRHDVWFSIGNVLMGRGAHTQAQKAFEQAVRLDPQHAQTLNNLAVTLGNLGQDTEAIAIYEQALACDPELADGLNNLALVLNRLDQRERSLALLRQCTKLHPGYALGWANLGMVLQGLGCLEEAIAAIDHALSLQPGQSGWLWNQSLAYLTLGDFERGWRGYESRYAPDKADSQTFLPSPLAFPMWRGEMLSGKRLLLVWEQGFGDQIQCLRFAASLAAQGVYVGVWVHPALAAIAATVPGVSDVLTQAPDMDYDYWAFMMSLPVRLNISEASLPGPMPYLFAQADKSAAVADTVDQFAQGRRRIGLNWAGNPSHPNDRNRSLDIRELAQWLAIPDIAWVSVQKDRAGMGAELVRDARLLPAGDAIGDFSDTAAILANIDLLITVDSAVAHLAGAMGVPTWLLLPENSDYRWMRDRDDTPWYPSVRLFRQQHLGDWQAVITGIAACLGAKTPAGDGGLGHARIEHILLSQATPPRLEAGDTGPVLHYAESMRHAPRWAKWLFAFMLVAEFIYFFSGR